MHHPTKIATCCYCGTRAALVLRGETRHELACAACGAPLRRLKNVPSPGRAPHWGPPEHRPATSHRADPAHAPSRPKPAKRRKRKSLTRRVLSEAFDLIEDLLD